MCLRAGNGLHWITLSWCLNASISGGTDIARLVSNTPMFEQATLPERRNVLGDWILRGAIAVMFVLFGAEKFPSQAGAPWVVMFQQIGAGDWFRYFTGVVEVLGGILVLIHGR